MSYTCCGYIFVQYRTASLTMCLHSVQSHYLIGKLASNLVTLPVSPNIWGTEREGQLLQEINDQSSNERMTDLLLVIITNLTFFKETVDHFQCNTSQYESSYFTKCRNQILMTGIRNNILSLIINCLYSVIY